MTGDPTPALVEAREDSPEALVERIQDGDGGAEEELVARFGRPVAILLERYTGGGPEAEDLFQDTFALAVDKLRRGELREPAKLPGFLARIARNLAIEHYRKRGRRRTEPDSEAVAAASFGGASPLSLLLERENAALVRRVLQELTPERDRQILLRYYIAEESRQKIAADFGVDNLQLNRLLYRARQRYKALYQERLGELAGRSARTLLLWAAILGAFASLTWGVSRASGA